jgi:hypothetical protein
MHTILDLDLDFFVWPPYRHRCDHDRLPDTEWEHLATQEDVRQFLERRCHLSKANPIPGRELVEHVDAFTTWSLWLKQKKLSSPFAVIHIDAHADLGAGVNLTCHYVETELLALPVGDRRTPRFGDKGINSGNYLVGAIANRWISCLTWVHPVDRNLRPPARGSDSPNLTLPYERIRWLSEPDDEAGPHERWAGDLPAWCFRDYDWRTGLIELRETGPTQCAESDPAPVHLEPPVRFDLSVEDDFEFSTFTHMVVAQSPQHTPVSADHLLPVIREYFCPT